MKKLLIIITALILLLPVTNGQLWKVRRYEVTAGIGTTQLYGDIGGYSNDKNVLGIKDFTFTNIRANVNAGVRYRITEDIAARVNLTGGLFHSSDAMGSKTSRGFESETFFFEPSLTAEYYFIKNKVENSFLFLEGKRNTHTSFFATLDFYAFAGIGGLAYKVNPNSTLAPFATQTSGFTEVIPLGLGINMIYNSKINFGIEFGARFTFSDNIDGYAPAASRSDDIYHLLNFTFTYKIEPGKKGIATFEK